MSVRKKILMKFGFLKTTQVSAGTEWALVAAVGRVDKSITGGHAAGRVVAVPVQNSIIKMSIFCCKKEMWMAKDQIV